VKVSCSQTPPRETILVVDDEGEVLALVMDILQGEGYSVLGASDPREALRLSRMQSESIDLLLTDVAMPFMTGPELAMQLRRMRPGMKVLYMSALTSDSIGSSHIQIAPGEPYLVKPFTVLQLSSKVRALLDYRSPFSRPDSR